ncbi:MAG: glycosyltransferase [Thermoplasmata archaeon]|nr:glycosyltransferase [Thermoplasmata archaeon]
MSAVLVASDGWDRPGTAMHGYARDVVASARLVGVDAIPGPLQNFSDGRRFGGTMSPVLRCFLTGYTNPDGRLVHNTGWPPNGRRGAKVVTFHDLWAFRDPDPVAFLRRAAYKAMARRARVIAADSAFTKEEVRRRIGTPFGEKTLVVPIPVAPPASSAATAKDVDVLWVGVDLPRKGLGEFLRATRTFPDLSVTVRWTPIRPAAPAPHLAAMLEPSRRPNLVHVPGRLSEEELGTLYARSRCIVSTSTYEGFHMPIMEAYLRGVAIVVPAEEPYLGMYGEAAGVHYYDRSVRNGRTLESAIRAAVADRIFTPSQTIRTWVSFRNVGEILRAAYESAART